MPIPESELPPISPDRHFIYCPDPMLLTDAQVDMLFPREVRHELFVIPKAHRASLTQCITQQHSDPTTASTSVRERTVNGQ